MKDWAKKDPKFCAQIHEEYTKLVQMAKEVRNRYHCITGTLPYRNLSLKRKKKFRTSGYLFKMRKFNLS